MVGPPCLGSLTFDTRHSQIEDIKSVAVAPLSNARQTNVNSTKTVIGPLPE